MSPTGSSGCTEQWYALLAKRSVTNAINLEVDFKFMIIAEINDVVAAVWAASLTAQRLGVNRKQR